MLREAANPDAKGPETSQRPFQTVIPLAAKLGPDSVTKYGVGQEEDLVAAILAQSGVVWLVENWHVLDILL